MKILVTGGDGQLANEIARQSHFDTIVLPKEKLDITSSKEIDDALLSFRPNVVINCASLTNVDFCETHAEIAMNVNAEGAKNLSIACNKNNAKLIHISSDYVFDGKKVSPYVETDIPNPLNVYGKSKQLSEQNVREYCDHSFIVRTAWLYGYTGNNFVKTILNAARRGSLLKVVNDQIGNPTNAVDIAKHLLRLAETEEYGTYHCTNNGECSWYDFANEFLRASRLEYMIEPCTTVDFPRSAKRPAYSSLDNLMLRQTSGDEMRLWQDAIAEYLSHYDKDTGEFNV